ncbi:hypothetical protein LTR16_002195, partial [Cryomyces antarcticus]
ASTDRRQSRPLRAQGAGFGERPKQLGDKVRGNGQEVRRYKEGARRLRCGDWQYL